MLKETNKHSIDGRKTIAEIEKWQRIRQQNISFMLDDFHLSSVYADAIMDNERQTGKALLDALDAGKIEIVEVKLDKKKRRQTIPYGNV